MRLVEQIVRINSSLGAQVKAYDYTDKARHDQAKQRSLEAIGARLARHEKVTWIALTLVLILAGLTLALLANHLFGHSN